VLGTCPACGAAVDGDVCDSRCEAVLVEEREARECQLCHECVCDCGHVEHDEPESCDGVRGVSRGRAVAVEHQTFPKPMRGESLLASRQRRADRTAQEQREMQAALKRDGRQCRFPRCPFASKKLPIDPCHETHRGIGGDPKGTRTTRATVLSLCRIHHGMWDRGEIDCQPLTSRGFNDCTSFFTRAESGRFECIATETKIGVSTRRGQE
jgi:hypothetical protein